MTDHTTMDMIRFDECNRNNANKMRQKRISEDKKIAELKLLEKIEDDMCKSIKH